MSFKTDALNDTLNYGLTASKVYDFATSDDIVDSPAGWETCYDKEHARLIVSGDTPQVFLLKNVPQGEHYYLKIDGTPLKGASDSFIQASINVGSDGFNLVDGGITTITTFGLASFQVVVKNYVINNIHIGIAHSVDLPTHSAIKDLYDKSATSYVVGDRLDITELRGYGYYDPTGMAIINFPLSKPIDSSVTGISGTSSVLEKLVIIGTNGVMPNGRSSVTMYNITAFGINVALQINKSGSSSGLPLNTSPVYAYVGGDAGQSYITFTGVI